MVLLEDKDLEWEAEFRVAADPECAVPNCSETLRGFIPLSTRSMNDARQVCSRIAGEYDGYSIQLSTANDEYRYGLAKTF